MQVVDAPGASVVTGHVIPVRFACVEGAVTVSVTVMLESVTFPVLVTSNAYGTCCPG